MASPGHTDLSFKALLEKLVRFCLKTNGKKKIMPAFQRFHVISSVIVSSVSALDTEDLALKEKKYEQ